MFKSMLMKSVMAALLLAVGSTLYASPWYVLGPRRKVVTLVIAGNYKSPRLLAELIQNESRQPYLLLPNPGSEDKRIFFCPPKGKCLEIRASRLNAFVRILNPQRIVVLGDARYTQTELIDTLDRTIPIVRIEGGDWERIAEEVNFLLGLSHVGTDYKKLRETLLNDGRIFRPSERGVKKTQSAKAEEPAVTAAAAEEPASDGEVPASMIGTDPAPEAAK